MHELERRGFHIVFSGDVAALMRIGALRLWVERHADDNAVWHVRLHEDAGGELLLDSFLRTRSDLVLFVARVDEIRQKLRTRGRV